MTLFQLGKIIGQKLIVQTEEDPYRKIRFVVGFLGIEVKNKRNGNCYYTEWGYGKTRKEAMKNYISLIEGKYLSPMGKLPRQRKLYKVPTNITC